MVLIFSCELRHTFKIILTGYNCLRIKELNLILNILCVYLLKITIINSIFFRFVLIMYNKYYS